MYFSGRAEVTAGEMRVGEKRGPWVEWDMLALPVVAAGDFHIVAGGAGRVGGVVEGFVYVLLVWELRVWVSQLRLME